jgi:molecular chaperone DnaK (HSP70)
MVAIGIDFGDRNTRVAYSADGVHARVLPSREQLPYVPSVVARHRDGTLLVGSTAERAARTKPSNTICSIKRLMGKRYDDSEVAALRRWTPYRIVPGPNGFAHVMIGEREYSPIEVSELILWRARQNAAAALGTEATHAVITVPPYSDRIQREAFREAVELAGGESSRDTRRADGCRMRLRIGSHRVDDQGSPCFRWAWLLNDRSRGEGQLGMASLGESAEVMGGSALMAVLHAVTGR